MCVNNDVCDCSKTHFTGHYCNQYKKLKRLEKIDKTITVITILFIIFALFIYGILYYCRDYPNIKGGKII